jgi:Xaa-Pro aminopeptidase
VAVKYAAAQMASIARMSMSENVVMRRLMLARQQDDIALDPNVDLIDREIGEVDVLGIEDGAIIIAVIANEACAAVIHNMQSPDLKFLGLNLRFELQALGVGVKRLGIEPSFLPSDAKDLLSKELGASLADAQFVLERLRAIKTAAELDLVREASERVVDAMMATFDICAPGMSKHDIVDRLRREEHERDLVFEYCLIAAGNSHNRDPSDQRLKQGDVISLDSGGNYKGYIGDLSRMGVVGEPDAELHDLLHEIEEIQQAARGAISPGARGGDIIAAGEEAVRRAPHGNVLDYTAHGSGLVSHEAPRLTGRGPVPYAPYDADRPLQPGMVISIETAMLHPSRGYIKLEDTLIVTEDGWEAPGDIARGWNMARKT